MAVPGIDLGLWTYVLWAASIVVSAVTLWRYYMLRQAIRDVREIFSEYAGRSNDQFQKLREDLQSASRAIPALSERLVDVEDDLTRLDDANARLNRLDALAPLLRSGLENAAARLAALETPEEPEAADDDGEPEEGAEDRLTAVQEAIEALTTVTTQRLSEFEGALRVAEAEFTRALRIAKEAHALATPVSGLMDVVTNISGHQAKLVAHVDEAISGARGRFDSLEADLTQMAEALNAHTDRIDGLCADHTDLSGRLRSAESRTADAGDSYAGLHERVLAKLGGMERAIEEVQATVDDLDNDLADVEDRLTELGELTPDNLSALAQRITDLTVGFNGLAKVAASNGTAYTSLATQLGDAVDRVWSEVQAIKRRLRMSGQDNSENEPQLAAAGV